MHELSLCANIIEIIKQRADSMHCNGIKTICLELGQLARIEKSSLLLSFKMVSQGTIAENAVLTFIDIPPKAQCDVCHKMVDINQYYDACSFCGNFSLTIIQGEELRIKSMEVV